MSLSVSVRARSASGSRASSRKYGDFTRAASTRQALCRSVNASTASGSSQGSQSSSARVKNAGTVWGGGSRTVSGMIEPPVSGGAGQDAQAGDHPDLERQESRELRQRHDVGGRPAGIQQGLQRLRRGVTWVEHQEVHVFERRGQTRSQCAANFRRDTMDRSGGVLAAQRAGGIGAVGALPLGRRDSPVDRTAQFRRCPACGQTGGVERGGLRVTVQAGDEGGHRETLCRGYLAGNLRLE